MSIQTIKTAIRKMRYQEQHSSDYKDIGSFIKKTRRNLRMTQDDIARGICSVSYLSKIENNQIIPTDMYVNEIMTRLNVDTDIYYQSIRDKEYLEDIIDAYFYYNEDKMQQIYQEIEHIKHDKIINLCKLGYFSYFNDQNESSFVMMLEQLINNMSTVELQFYILLALKYYIKMNVYSTALELLMITADIPIDNQKIRAMIYEQSFYIKNRLNLHNCANEAYKKANFLLQSLGNQDRILIMSYVKVESLISEEPNQASKLLESLFKGSKNQTSTDYYNILKSEILMAINQVSKAMVVLKEIDESSIYYMKKMVIMYEICLKNKDKEMMKAIKETLKDYHPSKEEMHDKIMYHYLIANKDDKKHYLRDIAIPFSIRTEHIKNLNKYTHEIMQICIDTSRYKEATQYYKKYQKEVQRIKQIVTL